MMKFFLICFTTFVVVCESALDIKIRFYGTRYSDSKLIKYGDDISSIVGTQYFDSKKSSVIITHGYSFYLQSRGAKPLIDAHIQNDDDINVIYVDWTAYTNRKVSLGHDKFEEVANGVYEMLSALKTSAKDFSNVSLLAFGIGSQLFGYVARLFIKQESFQFTRLTCLDPSGENFEKVYGFWLPDLKPIDRDCAKFVDVIHTNGGSIGDDAASGHVDFYINNGIKQPLCSDAWKLAYFALFDVQMFIGCDHQFAWIIYTESMKRKPSSPAFLSLKCLRCFEKGEAKNFRDECQEKTSVSMGYYAMLTVKDESMYGCYQVSTNDIEPYSKN